MEHFPVPQDPAYFYFVCPEAYAEKLALTMLSSFGELDRFPGQ